MADKPFPYAVVCVGPDGLKQTVRRYAEPELALDDAEERNRRWRLLWPVTLRDKYGPLYRWHAQDRGRSLVTPKAGADV